MSDTSREEKRQRRRHSRRTNGYDSIDASTIDIRIGNRKAPAKFNAIRVSGPRDAPVFQRMVDNAIRSNPRDPLFMSVPFTLSRCVVYLSSRDDADEFGVTEWSMDTDRGCKIFSRRASTTTTLSHRTRTEKSNSRIPYLFRRGVRGGPSGSRGRSSLTR